MFPLDCCLVVRRLTIHTNEAEIYIQCTSAETTVTKYQEHISGLLMDRIDIHIEVPHVEYEKLSNDRMRGRASRSAQEFKRRGIFNLLDSQSSRHRIS